MVCFTYALRDRHEVFIHLSHCQKDKLRWLYISRDFLWWPLICECLVQFFNCTGLIVPTQFGAIMKQMTYLKTFVCVHSECIRMHEDRIKNGLYMVR